jgi:hemerythrin
MDRFQLTNDLLTGIDDVDAQHRLIFDLANEIVDPTSERGGDTAFFDSLRFLSEYVQYHFAAEELAMQQTGFAEFEAHRSLHHEFRLQIGELIEISLESQSLSQVRTRLMLAVVGWLSDHIRIADKKLAKHLRAHAGDLVAALPDTDSLAKSGILDSRIDLNRIDVESKSAPSN